MAPLFHFFSTSRRPTYTSAPRDIERPSRSRHPKQAVQPFELPQFYMPYPARLNPHVERARAHSKKWAYAMGILGPGPDGEIWSEQAFDAHEGLGQANGFR